MRKSISGSSLVPGDLPFLESAIENGVAEIGTSYEVLEVNETRKRSGYIIKTKTFLIFLWKSSESLGGLLEAIYQMEENNDGYAVYAEPNKTTVEGIEFWIDDAIPRIWLASKKSNILDAHGSGFVIETKPSSRKKAN